MNLSEFKFKIVKYNNACPALQVLTHDGMPYCILSCNLETEIQGDDCIFVKEDSEEEEIARMMVSKGLLVALPTRTASGYNNYSLFQITDRLRHLVNE